jgi:hypothetical protein
VEKTIHIGNAVVCEYVAAGENGKTSLINVYSGDIIVSALPSSLHLGIYIELIPETDGDIDIQMEIMLGEKMLAEAHVKITGKKERARLNRIGCYANFDRARHHAKSHC